MDGSAPGEERDGAWEVHRVRITFASALALVAAVVGVAVVQDIASAAHRTLGWAVACFVVALLLQPVVTTLSRRMPRPLALTVTLVLIAGFVGVLWFGLFRNVRDGVSDLERAAPQAAAELEGRYEIAREFRLQERVEAFVEALDERFAEGATVAKAVGTVPTYIVTGILMLFFLIYGPRFVSGGLQQIRDPGRRMRAARVGGRALRRGRDYLLVAVAQAFLVGITVGTAAWTAELPAPVVLGFVAGLFSALPNLGILVGGMPTLLVALGLQDLGTALGMLALLIVLQLVETFGVRRRVDPVTVHVGPALPAIVGLVGWELYGLGGAVYGAAVLVWALAWADAVSAVDETPLVAES